MKKSIKLLVLLFKTNSAIFVNASSLIGTAAVTSGLGFVYWWLAARQFSLEAVGVASAAIAAMALLGNMSMLGLGTLLVAELPNQRGQKDALIGGALLVVGVVGACLGIGYAVVAPYLSSGFQELGTGFPNIGLFALGVSLTAITLVLDMALLGLLRGELQLWRNGLFSGVKLLALFAAGLWLSHVTGLTIYATWMLGNAASLLAILGFALFKERRLRKIHLPEWGILRKLGPAALKHHALNLTLQAPSLILPVLIAVLLSTRVNAWFTVSWNLASIGNTIAAAFTLTLYAVGSAQPSKLAHKMRLTLSLSFIACLVINVLLLFGTRQVLAIFGHSYSEQAAWSLRILSLESFPFIIKNHYIALGRMRNQIGSTLLITVATGSLELACSTLGAHFGGLNGLSLGWLLAVCFEAVCMSGAVYKAIRFEKAIPEVCSPQEMPVSVLSGS